MRVDRRVLALTGAVSLLAIASFLRNGPCLFQQPPGTGTALARCPSDLEVMWRARGLASGAIPYLQPLVDPQTGQLVTVEYPVLTGMLMWLLSRGGSLASFLALSTLVMGLSAVGIALLLNRWCGRRAWLWAAAPALFHYLAFNYDALPALTVVAAISLVLDRDVLRVEPHRYLGAAALLGVGGGLKLYPLLFALPLALWLLFGRVGTDQSTLRSRIGRAAAAAGTTAGVFIGVNLPFALANLQGWWLPFAFQANRTIDVTTLSLWFFAGAFWPGVDQSVWMVLATLATAAGIAAAVGVAWYAGRRRGTYPLVAACTAVLVAYLMFNKVFSPQYILWLLPLLVLAGLRARVVVVCLVVDVVIFASIAGVVQARENGLVEVGGLWIAVLLLSTVARFGYLVRVASLLFRPAVPSAAPQAPSAASG